MCVMELDHDICYRALTSRDARFDGRFFTAVHTTGIYCRPVCPARTPQRKNVSFYACAAAAEDAGFRACRRCRPETAPGTPAWSGTSATVARALRLIEAGRLDDGDVESLGDSLGIGGRHLRRLFAEQLGATPVAIAATRRAHIARRLLAETALPVAEVAHAAGFRSVRRFNEVMQARFAASPRVLRGGRDEDAIAEGADGAGSFVLRVACRRPFAWEPLLAFLAARAIPGVECVEGGSYARTVETSAGPGVLRVRFEPARHALAVEIDRAAVADTARLLARVRRLTDADADPHAIATVLRRDPLLRASLRSQPGLRVPGAWDGFEIAVRAIFGQQVSVAGARTIAHRLVQRCGTPLSQPRGALTHLFPAPTAVMSADLARLGVPGARAEAVRTLARAVHEGAVALDGSRPPEDSRAALCALPGIGEWTAAYIAMRALGEPDAFPAGDLILRRAAADGAAALTTRELDARSDVWRPWRAYAVMHLWRLATLTGDSA